MPMGWLVLIWNVPSPSLEFRKGYEFEAVFAVGKKADLVRLPKELKARESHSERRSLCELVFEGAFPEEAA